MRVKRMSLGSVDSLWATTIYQGEKQMYNQIAITL